MSEAEASYEGKGKGKETAYDVWLEQQGYFKKWRVVIPVYDEGKLFEYSAVLEDPKSAFKFFERGYKTIEPCSETVEQKLKNMRTYDGKTEFNSRGLHYVNNLGLKVDSDDSEQAVTIFAAYVMERHDDKTDEFLDELENPRDDERRKDLIDELTARVNEKKRQNAESGGHFFKDDSRYMTWEAPVENSTTGFRHE